jgi:hypothetical protein
LLCGTFRAWNNKMNDTTQASLPTPSGVSSPWSVLTGVIVVLIALASALVFVMTRQEQLRAANTTMETSPTARTTQRPAERPPTAEKKQTPKRATPAP